METQMIQVVQERVAEMVKNTEVQKIMMGFETTQKAQDWVIKAAVATLMGVQNKN